MQILFISNDGGGSADHIEVAAGTTIEQFFADRVPTDDAEDYLIRINRQPATAGQVLQPGDRVSFTPAQIKGSV